MKSELAPVTFGSSTLDPGTIMIGAVVIAVVLAFALGAKRETAMFAVFAGIVGVILAI